MKKDYKLEIALKTLNDDPVFSESYKIALWDRFVNNVNPKEHGFKNHVEGFAVQLKHNNKEIKKQDLKKWDVYLVNYGMNTGSEVNGTRPSILFKSSEHTLGDDVIAIPLTTAVSEKLADTFDVFVPKDAYNKLYQNSFARVRQMRAVSLARLGQLVGSVTNEHLINAINSTVGKMLAIDA